MCRDVTRGDQQEQGNAGDEGKETLLKRTLFENARIISATLCDNLINERNPSMHSW